MQSIAHSPQNSNLNLNGTASLRWANWPVRAEPPATAAGRHLVRRFGVPKPLADTVAALAGLVREAR